MKLPVKSCVYHAYVLQNGSISMSIYNIYIASQCSSVIYAQLLFILFMQVVTETQFCITIV